MTKVKTKTVEKAESRHRAGGRLLGSYPSIDKMIIDLRKHGVANGKRYALKNGWSFYFASNVRQARMKIINKGLLYIPQANDEKRALDAVYGQSSTKLTTAALRRLASAHGFKLATKK